MLIETHNCKRRIIFADTDAGGMMYFGQACRWIETGIHEWFRVNNFKFLDQKENKLFWVIREINIFYSSTIHFDEEITINIKIIKIQRYSLSFEIFLIGESNEKKISAKARLVPINNKTKKTIMIPESIFVYRQLNKFK